MLALLSAGCSTPLVLACSKAPAALLNPIQDLPQLEFYLSSEEKKAGIMKRSTEVKAHADCGIRYRQVKAQCEALIKFEVKANK